MSRASDWRPNGNLNHVSARQCSIERLETLCRMAGFIALSDVSDPIVDQTKQYVVASDQ